MMTSLASSSVLSAAGIEGSDLLIQFTSGTVYRYLGASDEYMYLVDESDAVDSDGVSLGRYFRRVIRDSYGYERVS